MWESFASPTGWARHLKVQPYIDGFWCAICAEPRFLSVSSMIPQEIHLPVTHDKTFPFPVLPQDFIQLRILARMKTIDLVVRSHYRRRSCFLNAEHEWHQIDLAQGSIGHDAIDSHTLMLLIIADKMLWGSNDVFVMDSSAIFSTEGTGQEGIF